MIRQMKITNEDENDENLYCPRCHGGDLINFGESLQCINCDMEFEKDDLELFDDDDILSIDEKLVLCPKFWSAWF